MDGLQPPTPMPLAAYGDPQALASHSNGKETDVVAHGFESMFASLLIKQMRASLEPHTLFGNDNGDVLGGLFDTYLGQHLAQTGALGIGAMVKHQLTQARASYERTAAHHHP